MKTTASTVRRSLYGIFAACAVGGAASVAIALPSATAAPDPCVASEVARTVGSVATSMGTYLDANPETNQALTNASQQPPPEALGALKSYFDANPQAGKELQALQKPLTDLGGQCKLPITIPQALMLLQGMQQGSGGLPGLSPGTTLPGGLPGAQTVGTPAGAVPAQTAPAVVTPATTGPLPGPSTRTAE